MWRMRPYTLAARCSASEPRHGGDAYCTDIMCARRVSDGADDGISISPKSRLMMQLQSSPCATTTAKDGLGSRPRHSLSLHVQMMKGLGRPRRQQHRGLAQLPNRTPKESRYGMQPGAWPGRVGG